MYNIDQKIKVNKGKHTNKMNLREKERDIVVASIQIESVIIF